jgi:Raf kinase inhibitor-like YbhB/YbcL family protein
MKYRVKGGTMAITLISSAFAEGQSIPSEYTCDGEDLSPPLSWSTLPDGTRSFALIADDPDAPSGTWVHWVLYDLPATLTNLPEGIPKDGEVLQGAKQGKNDFNRLGYGGPCPPRGGAHRYYFKIYALDKKLGLKAGAAKSAVEKEMRGHVLGEGELMGRYARK